MMIWARLPSTISHRARTVILPRPGPVAVDDPLPAADDAAGREVRAGDVLEQLQQRDVRVVDQRDESGADFRRLCGGISVAMPTAMPSDPLTSRFGNAARAGRAARGTCRRSCR